MGVKAAVTSVISCCFAPTPIPHSHQMEVFSWLPRCFMCRPCRSICHCILDEYSLVEDTLKSRYVMTCPKSCWADSFANPWFPKDYWFASTMGSSKWCHWIWPNDPGKFSADCRTSSRFQINPAKWSAEHLAKTPTFVASGNDEN
jgi:hypothetical protein